MGKLKKRSDGRYQKRVVIGRDGKRAVYKTVYAATVKELNIKVAEAAAKAAPDINERTSFAEWSDKWFAVYKGGREYNTKKQYRRMLDAYILPELGGMNVDEIKPFHVQQLINGLNMRVGAPTAKLAAMTVKQILSAAATNGLAVKNAAERVELPKAKRRTRPALNSNERSLVLDSGEKLPLKNRAFLFTLFFTGLRRGEILALTKNDVDICQRKISVTKTVVFTPNTPVVKPAPKSAAGVRDIPVNGALCEVLGEYIPTIAGDVVFPSEHGNYMSLAEFRLFWAKTSDAAGLPKGVTPHKFRHNFATELYYAGVDVKEAQRLLGHAGAGITMDIYTHYRDSENTGIIEKLDAIK